MAAVGKLGEVGEGSLLDAAAVAEGLSEEDGGGRGAVGDALDIHGYYYPAIWHSITRIYYTIHTLIYTWLHLAGYRRPETP